MESEEEDEDGPSCKKRGIACISPTVDDDDAKAIEYFELKQVLPKSTMFGDRI